MLEYTGHPFIDVGIAAITAFVNKRQPQDVTPEDLEGVEAFIKQEYVQPPLRGYLRMIFTNNAWFFQDSFNPDKAGLSSEEREAKIAERDYWASCHVSQWRAEAPKSNTGYCIFTGQAAIGVALAKNLQKGRIGIAQMPLLQRNTAINFFPAGDSGLPISGIALLALQFFPLGCVRCGDGLLAVHSNDNILTYKMTREFLNQNRRAMLQARLTDENNLPYAHRSLKTLLIETLLNAEEDRKRADRRATNQEQQPVSLTAYNFFSDGRAQELKLYHLPLEIIGFIQVARIGNYQGTWNQLVQESWQLPPTPRGKKKQDSAESFEPRRNFLYEDLFDLPANAVQFIRRYFLRVPRRTPFEDDPRRDYSLRRDVKLISWPLVELFLRKVVLMDASMIARIKEFGDRLSDYIELRGDKKFFRGLRVAKDYGQFRQLLIYKLEKAANTGVLLIDYDGYVGIFEDANETTPGGWRLARDLLLIRIIDQLYHRNKIADVADELEDEPELSE